MIGRGGIGREEGSWKIYSTNFVFWDKRDYEVCNRANEALIVASTGHQTVSAVVGS